MSKRRAIVVGAGTSKAYSQSPTRQRMPISTDFFRTFGRLKISENPMVLIGYVVNYLEHYHGISPYKFPTLDENIEVIHSEIEARLLKAKQTNNFEELHRSWNAYIQLEFMFASVLNEIQNGPVSKPHKNLVSRLYKDDYIITFNWDTLIDRALEETTDWKPDNGYYIRPKRIFRDGWVVPDRNRILHAPLLLKLHGSTNWLTSYLVMDENKYPTFTHNTKPETFFVFRYASRPYNCYNGRYMVGYKPYSYGYYPPNLTEPGKKLEKGHVLIKLTPRTPFTPKGEYGDKGLESMPLIIPPVKDKHYSLFGSLFKKIWEKAEDVLSEVDEVHIYGYSFPATDTQAEELFSRAFGRRKNPPVVIIVNPRPKGIEHQFLKNLGTPKAYLKVIKENIDDGFNFTRLL